MSCGLYLDVGSSIRATMVKIYINLAHLSLLDDKCRDYFLVALYHSLGNYPVHVKYGPKLSKSNKTNE